MHWDWFALFLVVLAVIGFRMIAEKIERIAAAIESIARQQGFENGKIVTKLDGVVHYLQALNEKLPPRR